METDKIILDACCGSRMFWFDKANPNVLFADIRKGDYKTEAGQEFSVKPDIQMDFTSMPFPDNTFQMVVFDPPHRTDLTPGNWMDLTYGTLFKTWETDLKQGVSECMRVLKPGGTLIFKWNAHQITVKKVLSIIEYKPLFGHTTGKSGKTIWMAFMKHNKQ